MGFADLHVHTAYSPDSTSSVSVVLQQAKNTATLDVIAITDHDTIAGALEAMDMAPHFGLEVIPGCEISTAEGHLLALFVKKQISPKMPLVETLWAVGQQGGLAVAPHPVSIGVHALSAASIWKALKDPEARKVLVGIEVFNAGIIHTASNMAARYLCAQAKLAPTGGSDSHVYWTVGQGITSFNGSTAVDLRRSLEAHTTTALSRASAHNLGFYFGHLGRYLLRSLGWVLWTPAPNSPFQLRRVTDVTVYR
jgi:predicted metal-dependent phosphoesterase TrpH